MFGEILRQRRDVERADVRRHLQVKRDEADERQQRADAQVKRDLERGVVLLLAATPHADHDERRHEREFVEEVEEKQVERHERAEDAARHHEQQDVKLLLARLDLERAARRRERHNRAHQNQPDVQAVHAQLAGDAERFRAESGNGADELVAVGVRRRAVELPEHEHRQQHRDERHAHRHGAHDDGKVARHKRQRDCGEQRQSKD